MHTFKKNIFMTSDDDDPVTLDFCAVWSAQNEGNIRMSTSGYLDFTAELAGKNIDTTPGLCVGEINAYKFAGDPVWVSASIPFSFTTKRATWNTNALPYRTDQVLTGIRFSFEIITTPYSEISASNLELFAEVTGSPQLIASYDSCDEIPPEGRYYSYRRDGSQDPEDPGFHVPTVEYTDADGNPQVFMADTTSELCGTFFATGIIAVHYCIECV